MKAASLRRAGKAVKEPNHDRNLPQGSHEKGNIKITRTKSSTETALLGPKYCNGYVVLGVVISLLVTLSLYWLNGEQNLSQTRKDLSSQVDPNRIRKFLEKGKLKHPPSLYIITNSSSSPSTPSATNHIDNASSHHNVNLLQESHINSKAYENSDSFLRDVSTSHEPVLIKNIPLEQWSLLNYDFSKFLKASNKASSNITPTSNIALPAARYLHKNGVFVARKDRDENGMIDEDLLFSSHCQNKVNTSSSNSNNNSNNSSNNTCESVEASTSGYRLNRRKSPEYVNTTLSDFMYETFTLDNYLYWIGELSHLENQLMALQVNSTSTSTSSTSSTVKQNKNKFHKIKWKLFQLKTAEEKSSFSTSSSASKRPMIWLAHPGVVTQTHYDTQHNFMIQLQGFTRYLLFAPDTELYFYPSIHPAESQSQIHLEEPALTVNTICCSSSINHTCASNVQTHALRYPFYSVRSLTSPAVPVLDTHLALNESNCTMLPPISSVNALEVSLHPGDVLYIPPYWSYRAESVSLSMSVSVSSASHIERAFLEIYRQKVRLQFVQVSV